MLKCCKGKNGETMAAQSSEQQPLEKMAKFLAAFEWSLDLMRRPRENDPKLEALERADSISRTWRKQVGAARIMMLTCLMKPTTEQLKLICQRAEMTEEQIMQVWQISLEIVTDISSVDLSKPDVDTEKIDPTKPEDPRS